MADGLSPQLQAQLQQLQSLNQQLQAAAQQKANFEAMKTESEQAIAALEGLPDDAPVYRNVGSLLVREPSRKVALERLKDDLETLEVRLTRVGKQEAAARTAATQLQQSIQASLPKQ